MYSPARTSTSPISHGRTIQLIADIDSLISDTHAVIEHAGKEDEPTAEGWIALELQLQAVPDLLRAREALKSAVWLRAAPARKSDEAGSPPSN